MAELTRRLLIVGAALLPYVSGNRARAAEAKQWGDCPGCVASKWCCKHRTCAAEYEPPLRG